MGDYSLFVLFIPGVLTVVIFGLVVANDFASGASLSVPEISCVSEEGKHKQVRYPYLMTINF